MVTNCSLSVRSGTREMTLKYAAFALSSEVELDKARSASASIEEQLSFLTPEKDEAILHETNFPPLAISMRALPFEVGLFTLTPPIVSGEQRQTPMFQLLLCGIRRNGYVKPEMHRLVAIEPRGKPRPIPVASSAS